MYPKFGFIRRFAQSLREAAQLVAFDIELEVDVTERELAEELQSRGYGVGTVA